VTSRLATLAVAEQPRRCIKGVPVMAEIDDKAMEALSTSGRSEPITRSTKSRPGSTYRSILCTSRSSPSSTHRASTGKWGRHTIRHQSDDSPELPDYSGPFNQNLRFSDFSNDALINMLEMSDEYYRVCIAGWAEAVGERYGRDDMLNIQSDAWRDMILPQLPVMIGSWMDLTDDEAESLVAETQKQVTAQVAAGRTVLFNPYKPEPEWVLYSKERLVKLALGATSICSRRSNHGPLPSS